MGKVIRIQRGNAFAVDLDFTDRTGEVVQPYPLSGKTISFTVKKSGDKALNDDGAVIKHDWSTHSETEGLSTLYLTKEQTSIQAGNYLGDFKIDGVCTDVCEVIIENVITTR
jgi:hypothetical protein